MSDSDKLAIAAHLHVLLRRKTGRVTDTEWMAANADYAQEIVRFARQRATEDNAPDLAEWADRLEQALHASRTGGACAPRTAPRARPRGAALCGRHPLTCQAAFAPWLEKISGAQCPVCPV